MNVKFWNLFLVLALLLSLSVGGGILYQNHLAKQAEMARIKAEEMQKVAEAQNRERKIKAEFEEFLNALLKQIAAESELYKKSRMVLTGLVQPMNMAQPEYIKENAALAEDTLATLRGQMDKIMNLFTEANQRVEKLTADISPEARATILESWNKMRAEEIGLFVQYFESEQVVLDDYKALIDFYAQKREALHVDAQSGEIVFDDPEDEKKAMALRAEIKELTIQQGQDLLSGVQEEEPATEESAAPQEPEAASSEAEEPAAAPAEEEVAAPVEEDAPVEETIAPPEEAPPMQGQGLYAAPNAAPDSETP